MKLAVKIKRKYYLLSGLFGLMLMIIIGCVYIDGTPIVNQGTEEEPKYYVNAGEVATFTLNGHIECAEDHSNVRFITAILVPKSWNARENTTVTYVSTMDDGHTSFTMSPIPETTLPKNGGGLTWSDALTAKYGVGTNVLNDMEWVAFQTDKVYTIGQHQNPTFTITYKCKTGPKNLKAHIGFFINHSDDGLSSNADHYKVAYSEECFEVVNGEGGLIDFCAYHFNQQEPLAALQDDYITFTFLGDTYTNELINEESVYFEAVAVTDAGNRYSVNEKTDKTLMRKSEQSFSHNYSLTIWPADFFGIPKGETILKIEYIFTNEDGTINVTKSDDEEAIEGNQSSEAEEPFVAELTCG